MGDSHVVPSRPVPSCRVLLHAGDLHKRTSSDNTGRLRTSGIALPRWGVAGSDPVIRLQVSDPQLCSFRSVATTSARLVVAKVDRIASAARATVG